MLFFFSQSHFELGKEDRFKLAKRVSIFVAFVNVLEASSMAAKKCLETQLIL